MTQPSRLYCELSGRSHSADAEKALIELTKLLYIDTGWSEQDLLQRMNELRDAAWAVKDCILARRMQEHRKNNPSPIYEAPPDLMNVIKLPQKTYPTLRRR